MMPELDEVDEDTVTRLGMELDLDLDLVSLSEDDPSESPEDSARNRN